MPVPIDFSNAEMFSWGRDCEGWKFLERPDLAVTYERIPPGRGELSHYHRKSRQFFFILSGEASFLIGKDKMTLQPGQGLEIPPGLLHSLWNDGREDLSFLMISAPDTKGDRVNLG